MPSRIQSDGKKVVAVLRAGIQDSTAAVSLTGCLAFPQQLFQPRQFQARCRKPNALEMQSEGRASCSTCQIRSRM